MPASLITFAHFGISDWMIAANSSGEFPIVSRPRSASLARRPTMSLDACFMLSLCDSVLCAERRLQAHAARGASFCKPLRGDMSLRDLTKPQFRSRYSASCGCLENCGFTSCAEFARQEAPVNESVYGGFNTHFTSGANHDPDLLLQFGGTTVGNVAL
jgi:hypothetical protein